MPRAGDIRPLALTLVLTLALAACDRGPGAAAGAGGEERLLGRLTITGSSTMAPLVGEIARRFEELHPGVRVDVQSGGTSQGIADVRRGTADLGMISRAPGEQEEDLVIHLIARDGIAMIVHRDNPVTGLGDDAVREIFTGGIRRWSEVGGPDRPITVVHKADGRATLVQFLNYLDLRAGDVRASIIIGDNQHGIRTVAADPDAIGYVSIGSATFEVDRGSSIRMITTGGVAPSLDAVLDGSFPLSRPLLLVGLGGPDPLAEAFVRFATSPAVHDLVIAQHFVPRFE